MLHSASLVRQRLDRHRFADRSLSIGVMPGLLATSAAARFEAEVPGCRVTITRLGWSSQIEAVRSGAVDVAYAREVIPAPGLHSRDLLEEPRDVVLPVGHPLSALTRVAPTDLQAVLLLQDASVAPEWVAVASPEMRRRSAIGAAADTVEEKLELVAAGRGFVVLPRSTTAAYRRPDIVVLPSSGFSPSKVSLVWRADERDAVRDRFIAAAVDQAHRTLAG